MIENRTSSTSLIMAHSDECEQCRVESAAFDRLAAILDGSTTNIDVAMLSRKTAAALRPQLARRAQRLLWRRVSVAILLALLPLPLVLIYDAYLLDALFRVANLLLPTAFAAYLVATYGAFLVLLFGGTYAAIPLLMANRPILPAAAIE